MANFLIAALFGSMFFVSLFSQHRFSPVRIWLFIWTLAFAINFFFGDVYYYSTTVLLIVTLGVVSYAIGAFVFWGLNPSTEPADPASRSGFMTILMQSRALSVITTLLLLVQIVLIDRGMRAFSNSNLLQLLSQGRGRMFEIMKESQASLYANNEFNFPWEFKVVGLILSFLAVFVFLRLSAPDVRRSEWINVLILIVVSLMFSAAANVRSLLLVPIIVGFFSFYTGAILNQRTHLLTSSKTVIGVVITIVLFGLWIVVVQSARLGDPNFERVGVTLNHMRPWFGGYVPALSVWFDDNYGNMDYLNGGYFFRSVLAPLGLVSGEGFDERTEGVDIGNWQTSNAMTIFRVFITDFGPVGAVIFTFFLGFFGEMAYCRALRFGGGWIALLIAYNCATFFSINFWFFFYGARLFSFIGAALVMSLLIRGVQRRLRRTSIQALHGPISRKSSHA